MSVHDPDVFVPRHHAPRQPDDPFAGCFRERGAAAPAAEPRGYRVRSDEVWAAAREDYEIGFSAEVICQRMNLGLSAFRQRARREGWRREDQAAAEDASPMDGALEPDPAPPTPELVDLAWRSMAEAVKRGDVYKARAWMKLHAELKTVVRDEERAASAAASKVAGGLAERTPAETAPAQDTLLADIKAIAAEAQAYTKRLNALYADEDGTEEEAFENEDEIDFGCDEPGGDFDELHPLHPKEGVQSSPSAQALTLPASADAEAGPLPLPSKMGEGFSRHTPRPREREREGPMRSMGG